MTPLGRVRALLAASVSSPDHGPASALLAGAGTPELDELVGPLIEHGLAGCAADRWRPLAAAPEAGLQRLELHARRAVGLHLRVQHLLPGLAGALDEAGVPYAVLKGPVLAGWIYENPSWRRYHDLDLLVSPSVFDDAIEVLAKADLTDLNHNWGGFVRHRVAELPMRAGDFTIDLHWHVIGLGRHRAGFAIDTDDLLARRRTLETGVPTLDQVDTLVHLCLHAGLAGANRLIWLKDIEQAIRREPPDWDAVIQRARHWGAGPMTGAVLDRSRRIIGAAVPDDVVSGLLPTPSREAVRWLDKLPRSRRALARSTHPKPIVSALRARRRETLATLGRELIRQASARVRGTERDSLDEEDPLSWARDSGGAEGRARYLDLVRRGKLA